MSGIVDSFPLTDSSFYQFENTLLQATQKAIFSISDLADQSLTMEKGVKGNIPDFHLEPQEEGGFVAFSREFPGAVGQGETIEEAIADLEEAIQLLKEVLEEDRTSQK